MSEYAHLRIKEDTHKKVKVLAAELSLTHDDTINMLLEIYERCEAQRPRYIAPGTAKDFDGSGTA